MENNGKKTVMTIISVFNALFILLCVVGCSYILFTECGKYYKIAAASEMIALVFSVLYYCFGYKKDAAKYYRMFMLFYAFTYIAETFASIIDYDAIGVSDKVSLTLVVSMILYGNTIVLAVGKDIGKAISYAICAVNVIFYALPVLAVLLPDMEIISFESPEIKYASIILYCTWLVLALNAFIMTMAKYTDKARRGTK